MITKSKIKTFNNTRKYIKKNKNSGGGELLPGTDKKAAIDVQNLINTINNGQETGNYITFDTTQNEWFGIFSNDNLKALMKTGKLNETKEFKISVVDKRKMSIKPSTKSNIIKELNELLDKDLTTKNGYLPKDGPLEINQSESNQSESNQPENNSPENNKNKKNKKSMVSSIFGEKKKESIPVSELVTNLKTNVDTLSEKISNININIENEDATEICKNLSDNLNPIGIFINDIYKYLNNFVLKNNYTGIKIDGYQLVITKRKFVKYKFETKKKLSLLILSKIIHGKINKTDWPPQKQRDLYIHTLRMKTGNKITNLFKKTGESINKGISNKFRDLTGLKRRNNTKQRVNNMVGQIPGAGTIPAVPGVSVTDGIPNVKGLAEQIPGASALSEGLPDPSAIAGQIPDPSALTEGLPSFPGTN